VFPPATRTALHIIPAHPPTISLRGALVLRLRALRVAVPFGGLGTHLELQPNTWGIAMVYPFVTVITSNVKTPSTWTGPHSLPRASALSPTTHPNPAPSGDALFNYRIKRGSNHSHQASRIAGSREVCLWDSSSGPRPTIPKPWVRHLQPTHDHPDLDRMLPIIS
jgi:hypothetical protein